MATHQARLLTGRPISVTSEDTNVRDDENAFAEALLAVTEPAFRCLRAIGLSPDDAADVLQDAAIRAWRHRAQRRGAFAPWFMAITYREARRPHRRWPSLPAFWRAAEAHDGSEQPHDDLDNALAKLPLRQRTALVLRYGSDMSIADVAGVLRISEPAAKQLLARARESVRRSMASPEVDA